MYDVRPARRAFTVNSTQSGGFAASAPTITEPSGDGVFNLVENGQGLAPCFVYVSPFGTDAANETFALRIIGWKRIEAVPGSPFLFWPITLVELTCTLSAAVGVAGAPVIATEFFCDTLAIVSNSEPVMTADVTNSGTVIYSSPANDTPAFAKVDLHGVEKVQFKTNVGTGASGNTLFWFSNL